MAPHIPSKIEYGPDYDPYIAATSLAHLPAVGWILIAILFATFAATYILGQCLTWGQPKLTEKEWRRRRDEELEEEKKMEEERMELMKQDRERREWERMENLRKGNANADEKRGPGNGGGNGGGNGNGGGMKVMPQMAPMGMQLQRTQPMVPQITSRVQPPQTQVMPQMGMGMGMGMGAPQGRPYVDRVGAKRISNLGMGNMGKIEEDMEYSREIEAEYPREVEVEYVEAGYVEAEYAEAEYSSEVESPQEAQPQVEIGRFGEIIAPAPAGEQDAPKWHGTGRLSGSTLGTLMGW